jgi:hypothetical protein
MTAAPNPDLKAQARAMLRQNLSAFHPVAALYPLPAIVLVLAIGVAAGQPGPTLLAGAGAFSAGFGAFQRVSRFRLAPILLAAACMAISTGIGTALSGHFVLYVLAVTAGAFSLGLGASFGLGPWWVLLQGAIFLVLSSGQPGDLKEAGARALLVLAGGLVQAVSVALLHRLFPRGFPPISAPNAAPPPATAAEWRTKAREVLRPGSTEMRYAALLGLASAAAVLLARSLAIAHGYWVPLTVLLVLRQGGAQTVILGLQRIVGTILGAGAATLVAAILRPDPWLLLALMTVPAWLAYAAQWVNYGTFSAGVTSYIAFLLALQGLPEAQVAIQRVVATLIGGGLGMAALGAARLGGRAVGFRG